MVDWSNKDDVAAYQRAYRLANREKLRAYEKARGMLPKNVALRTAYAKTEAGKKAHNKHTRIQRKRNPEKYKARYLLTNAVHDGRITKPEICEKCGRKARIEAHHSDYSKPFEVDWLCRPCHNLKHKCSTPSLESNSGPSSL